VTVHIDVEEHGDKQALDTPGGEELQKRAGGGGGGLPFLAFFDSHGAMIVNSVAPARIEQGKGGDPGGNIGYPSAPSEVDWFLVMLGKAAPRMTPQETGVIENYLRNPKNK
jgi:hypothetical protein